MRLWIFVLTGLALFGFWLLGCSVRFPGPKLPPPNHNFFQAPVRVTRQISLRDARLTVEVADTPSSRAQGLAGRADLPKDTGMLFIFPEPGYPTFWMQGMNFPLDFIWLRNGRVVEVTQGVLQPTPQMPEPRRLSPSEPVDAVIEVEVGWVAAHGIEVGDTLADVPST